MKDNEYLVRIVDSISFLHASDYVIVFNTNHQIVYATNSASRLMLGSKEAEKSDLLYGKGISELPHPIAKKYDYLKTVMPRPSNISLIMIENYFNDDYELLPGIVSAQNRSVINPATGSIVGFMCVYKVNPELSIEQLHKLIDHANFELSNSTDLAKNSNVGLTPRQQHVLVLLIKNMSVKEIAAYLSAIENRNISHMTIHNIINGQLFGKFGVTNVNHLQQKVFSTNFHHKLIQSLLFKQLILIK